MANVTRRANKDGTTSYRVKVSAGLGADGRYVYRSATFTPPTKLTARQTEKAVQEFARDFEQREDGKYKAKAAFIEAFPKGTRIELQKAAGLSQGTMAAIMQGRTVSKQSAEKIAAAAGWAFTKAFSCTSTDTLSASSQRHYHLMLSSMFSTAVRWQLMDANPCERVTPPKLVEQDVEFLDETGISDLLAALPDAPVQLSVITQLALFTGARRGEICGLRWSDIDLDAGVMAINRNLSYIAHKGTIFDYPKTKKSRRCIKLSDDCIALLKDYKQWQMRERLKVGTFWQRTITIEGGKLVKNDLLFTKPDGKPIDPNVVSSWFPVFLREHGLSPCRFHSLRHSNAALLIAAHVPATTVAGRLGHAQVSTTTNIYAAMIRSSDAAAADALGNIFDRIKQRQEIG